MSTEEETKKEETKASEAGDDGAHEVEENTAHFEPVVQLDEVEVVSGEEEEEVIFSQRSKLFIYGETLLDKGTGNKSWRERGIGEMKILKHKESQKYRVLMRQEKTMKPICNHVIDPRLELQPQMSSDRAWMWSCYDFSEGELIETIFAVRFSNSDIANDFKAKFEECQEKTGELVAAEGVVPEDAEATAAAEETAEKLADLKTSE